LFGGKGKDPSAKRGAAKGSTLMNDAAAAAAAAMTDDVVL
jgi:hypothetical protein